MTFIQRDTDKTNIVEVFKYEKNIDFSHACFDRVEVKTVLVLITSYKNGRIHNTDNLH